MTHHDEEMPLGVPVMKPGGKSEAIPSPQRTVDSPETLIVDDGRHPEDELGLPVQLPSGAREPTQQERAAMQAAEEAEAIRQYADAQEDFNRLGNWERLIERTVWLAVVAVVALLSLFVFAQSVQILAILALQPQVIQWVGWACLAALLLILAASAVRLVRLFFRLRANRQVSLRQFQELSRRAELRKLVDRDKALARKELIEYLKEYHYGQTPTGGMIHSCFNEQVSKQLREARDYLLDAEQFVNYDSWLEDFEQRFQKVLDNVADQVVQRSMIKVGTTTAISQWPLADTLLVLYCSYGMIGDLCVIFNLRMTRPGIIRLLGYTSFNAYAAGQIEQIAPQVVNSITSCVPVPGAKVLGELAAPVVGGIANAMLIKRLGSAAIARLRPVTPH